MSTISCPPNLTSLPLYRTKTLTETRVTKTFYVKAMSSSVAKNLTTNGTAGIVAAPTRTLLEYSPDSLQYEQGMLGAVPDGGVMDSPVSAMEYLTGILTSKVYDVAIESPLQHATKLSERLGVNVWLKREDAQPVFSFKLRGAYNMIAKLSKEKLEQGIICSSAGNHAQGVALAAKTLGCDAVIVMPVTTPRIKWESVKRLGATVVLEGDSYDEAQAYAKKRGVVENRTFIPPFDHPDVISGQGTVGMEIVRQLQGPIHAIFVPVGGGGLIAGIAAYVKRVSPQVKIIGVEPADANAMALSLHHGQRIVLDQVGGFADGVAVKEVGVETFRLCRELIDGIVLVSRDAICGSIKDMFEEKRSILEPAGALALAGAEAYCRFYNLKDENVVAITSGANMNFDRLRLVTELANIGRQQEAVLTTFLPEVPGSIKQFCNLVGPISITEFKHNTTMSSNHQNPNPNTLYTSPRPPITLPPPHTTLFTHLFRNLASHPNSPALINPHTNHTITHTQLKTLITTFSHKLIHTHGVTKNDVVLIFSPNSVLFPVAFLAVTAIGGIVTTANPVYGVNELAHQVKDSRPKVIISVDQLKGKVNGFGIPIVDLNSVFGLLDLNNLELNESVESVELGGNVGMDDVAAILYSSGTTGLSKGVVLTHRSIIATALMVTSDQEVYNEGKCVFLLVVPLFHIMGLVTFTYSQLSIGNAMVVMSRFDLKEALGAMEKFRVTHLYTAPPVVVALVKNKGVVRRFDVSALREIGSGAAPLGKDAMDECSLLFPQAYILQGYGMTETGGIISIEDPRIGSRHSGSSGTLCAGMESQIIHIETLKSLPPNQLGEIWVRGPNLMKEYFHNKEATEQTIDKEGWLHTGDLGYFDEEGRIYVVDRLKELIKYKGYQVAPAELEGLLVTHPEILDAAVIPYPDEVAGEIPMAYVVRKQGSSLSTEEVQTFIAKQVAPFKRIRKVAFIDIIPKAASGKILRRELRQKVESKL